MTGEPLEAEPIDLSYPSSPLSSSPEIKKINSEPLTAAYYQCLSPITLYAEKDQNGQYRHEVRAGECAATKNKNFIFTQNLGSSQGVIATLTDGDFALYHASSPDSCHPSFKDFIRAIKGKVIEIYVLQKKENGKNCLRAPVLAVELGVALGVDVIRLEIAKHATVLCDSKSNRVIISAINKLNIRDAVSSVPGRIVLEHDSKLVSAREKLITYQQSIDEVIQYNEAFGNQFYAEARLALALAKKNRMLLEQVKTELTTKQLSGWLRESQHGEDPEILANFHFFRLHEATKRVQPKPIADEKSKMGWRERYRQWYLKKWEKKMAAAVEKGDYPYIQTKLLPSKLVKKDKLNLLMDKLYPKALEKASLSEPGSWRERICELMGKTIYRTNLSLQASSHADLVGESKHNGEEKYRIKTTQEHLVRLHIGPPNLQMLSNLGHFATAVQPMSSSIPPAITSQSSPSLNQPSSLTTLTIKHGLLTSFTSSLPPVAEETSSFSILQNSPGKQTSEC